MRPRSLRWPKRCAVRTAARHRSTRACAEAASTRSSSASRSVPETTVNAPDAIDKDLPVKEDTRLLGRVLGAVLRAQLGDDGFERIEAIRQTAIGFRRAAGAEAAAHRRALTGLLNPLP